MFGRATIRLGIGPHSRFHLDASNRLDTIHQLQTGQDRTDRQTDRHDRQRSDIIGQTILQTVAQKINAIKIATQMQSLQGPKGNSLHIKTSYDV